MRKVYISLEASPLSIDVLVGGRLRSADFTGGIKHPIVLMPKFTTEDKDLMKALEESASFGTSFALQKEVATDGESYKMLFATVKEAKDFLNSEKHIPYNKMTSKEGVIAVGLELGIEIEFEIK